MYNTIHYMDVSQNRGQDRMGWDEKEGGKRRKEGPQIITRCGVDEGLEDMLECT